MSCTLVLLAIKINNLDILISKKYIKILLWFFLQSTSTYKLGNICNRWYIYISKLISGRYAFNNKSIYIIKTLINY